MLKTLIYCFVFLLGACWGSFLNCLIYRWEQGEKLNRGRSFCPKCHHQLAFWDLIPVFSFIFLRRKCRYCQKPISWQYLAVEVATGILFVLIFWHLNFGFARPIGSLLSFGISDFGFRISDLVLNWFITSCLIVIFIYDLKHYIIPDQAIYPAIGAIVVYKLFSVLDFGHWDLFRISDFGFRILETLKMPIIAAISAGTFFFLIWFVSRGKWMGFGDVKLSFFMGLFLGFPKIILALFAAFLSGAVVGVILLVSGRKKIQSQVPFGPFLVLGTLLAWFFGQGIIAWYMNLLL